MKEELELVDVFALFAMLAILKTADKCVFPHEIAQSAYEFAEAMMEERENHVD
jgi:hypothetical protein